MSDKHDSVWSARDTTPEAIERALRELLVERHAEEPGAAPARVLNLVAVVDREWSGEIANRLRRVGRFHPSRTVICQVEPGRTQLDATVSVATDEVTGGLSLIHELVIVNVGPQHLPHIESIVDPLVVTDLPTVAWSPHGYPEALDALLHNSQIVLLDSIDEPEAADALRRAAHFVDRAVVVDLAWLRSTPWRERLAAYFDPPVLRNELRRLSEVTIRHDAGSPVAGLLLLGWLADRLGWEPSTLLQAPSGAMSGTVRARREDVHLTLEPIDLGVPGLSGLTLRTADGVCVSMDRGAGGLHAVRSERDGTEDRWTIMGASRGEGGILGEGIRQALLRDPLYQPALSAAIGLA